MTYYEYDPITLELKNIDEAAIDPIEYKPIIPQNATIAMPPTEFITKSEASVGKACVYNKEKKEWETIDDFRGKWRNIDTGQEENVENIYDTSVGESYNERQESLKKRYAYNYNEKKGILTLRNGNRLTRVEIPESYKLTGDYVRYDENARGFVPDIDKILGMKDSMSGLLTELKKGYDDKCEELLTYKGQEFQVNEDSLTQMRNYITLMEGTGKSVDWVCADNTTMSVNANDLKNIVANTTERNKTYFAKYQEIKNSLKACNTLDEIKAICPNYDVFLSRTEENQDIKFTF